MPQNFMKTSGHDAKVFKVNQEINFLKEDLRRVAHPSIKSYIQNAIAQKESSLRLIIQKHLTRPPEAGRKILDKEVRNAVK